MYLRFIKELGEFVGETLVDSSPKNSPLKRVKRSSPRMTVKKKVLAEFSDEGNNESSPDTHTRYVHLFFDVC